MPEPALMYWILLVPALVAVVDLIRTAAALRQTPPSQRQRGPWSDAVNVGPTSQQPARR